MTKSLLINPIILNAVRIGYALHTLTAHLTSLIRRLFFTVFFKGRHAPRPGDRTVSPTWLTSILQSHSIIPPNTHITSIQLESLSENRGLTGGLSRLRIVYNISHLKAPKTLILKTSGNSIVGRVFTIVGGRYREPLFYNSGLRKEVEACGIHIPKIYYAYGSAWMGEYVMVMEDLAGSEISTLTSNPLGANMVFGNQVWGVSEEARIKVDKFKEAIGEKDPVLEVLDSLFKQSALLHARFWNDPRLLQTSWLKGREWYNGSSRISWELSIDAAKREWTSAKRTKNITTLLPPHFISIIDTSLTNASWSTLQQTLRTTSFTLCHGDFHASNIFTSLMSCNTPKYTLYDWSEIGPWNAPTDLAQMIISDVPIKYYTHLPSLVRRYHTHLTAHGVDPETYPFEQCWKEFCEGGVQRWIVVFAFMSNLGLPDEALEYFAGQMMGFMELDCGGREKGWYELKPVVGAM